MKELNLTGSPLRVAALMQVLRELRARDLSMGYCFMIFDDRLPEGHAYYEYPDGHITIEEVNQKDLQLPRKVVRIVTRREASRIREQHEVLR